LSVTPLADSHVDGELTFTVLDLSPNEEAALQAQESRARFRLLFQTISEGVVFQGADGAITDANPAAESLLGLTVDQMLGRTSVDPRWRAVRSDGTDYPGAEHPAMVALRTGRPVTGAVMGICHPLTGQTRWLRVNATPLYTAGGTAPTQVYTTFVEAPADGVRAPQGRGEGDDA
jgi:two-component system CheB/CheR fusion protein